MSENSKILTMLFESFAEYARQGGTPQPASCFDSLARSVEDVSPETLDAYVRTFQKIDDGKLDFALKQSIQQGVWSAVDPTGGMVAGQRD
jgi:hypothetical protein